MVKLELQVQQVVLQTVQHRRPQQFKRRPHSRPLHVQADQASTRESPL